MQKNLRIQEENLERFLKKKLQKKKKILFSLAFHDQKRMCSEAYTFKSLMLKENM